MTPPVSAGSAPPPSQTGFYSRIRFATTRAICGLPGYAWTLGDRDPGQPVVQFPTILHGDTERGSALRDGVFPFAGQVIRRSSNPWSATDAGEAWLTALNGFSWLSDLKALEGDAARRRGIGLILDWIEHNRKWSSHGWNAATMGTRITNWLINYSAFFDGADEIARRRVRRSLTQQVVHLDRIALHDTDGAARLVALKGLIYAGLALPPFRRSLEKWGQQFERELARQILPDGGHLERCPSVLISVLRHVVDCRKAYQAAKIECPNGIRQAIDRMAPMAMALRLPDGGLCLFNDSVEGNAGEIAILLAEAGVNAKPLRRAPHSGFERIEAGRTILVMDSGAPPAKGFDHHAHAGTLSFELSVGKERMIVNCGAAVSDDALWRDAQRATAAHSTLCLADTNSSVLTADGVGERRAAVTVERNEQDDQVWLETSHSGYARQFGYIHRRRLFVSANGEDIRGEDILEPVDTKQAVTPHPFEIRFHLHPTVRSSLLANHSAALLRLASGAGWRFRATGGSIALEDTIYLGKRAEPRRSQQIILRGETGGEPVSIKWALRRESKS